MDGGAVGYAVAAALCIAVGSALQHHAVAIVGGHPSGVGLVLRLTHNGRWMVGLVVTGAGTVLHTVALRNGALAVVEPVLVMNLALALPARALLDRTRPSAAHAAGAVVLGVGVALFVVAARPSIGHSAADTGAVGVLILAGVTLAGLCSAVAAKSGSERIAGVALGLAAGALYGVSGGVLKAIVQTVMPSPAAALTGWPLWALCALTTWAFLIHQQAYARAPLRVSLPVLSVANPLAGMVFGAVAFGEIPARSLAATTAEAVGLVIVLGSVFALTRPEASKVQGSRLPLPRLPAEEPDGGQHAADAPAGYDQDIRPAD